MTDTKPGALVGDRFLLERELGQGGAAKVWLARDQHAGGAEVALKVLHSHLRLDTRARDRFEQEAKLLAELEHPGFVRALAWMLSGAQPYIAMEYTKGACLDQIIRERREDGTHFRPEELERTWRDLFGAVAHAHARGVIHRDLKPNNIFLVPDETRSSVRVLDFGVARLIGESDRTTVGRLVGTFAYMSPEQALGEPVDIRSDVFSLALIAHEMLTLERAWPSGLSIADLRNRITSGPRPRPSLDRPELPVELDPIMARATAIEPEARTATVEQLLAELLPLLAEIPTPTVVLAERRRSTLARPSEDNTPIEPTDVLTTPAKTLIRPRPLSVAQLRGLIALVVGIGLAIGLALSLPRGTVVRPPSEPEGTVVRPPSEPRVSPRAEAPEVDPEAGRTTVPDRRTGDSRASRFGSAAAAARPRGGAAAVDRLQSVKRLLAEAEAHPQDAARFRALIAALRADIGRVQDPATQAKLLRHLEVAELSYDRAAARRILSALEAGP